MEVHQPAPVRKTPLEEVEVAKFWRNRKGEAVIVKLREFEGRALIDCRVHFTTKEGTFQPTQKGLTLVIARLPDLLRAVTKAHAKAIELGLLSEGGE